MKLRHPHHAALALAGVAAFTLLTALLGLALIG
jgi:hypothetical protein